MWVIIGLLWLVYLFLCIKSRKLPCEEKKSPLQRVLWKMSSEIVSHRFFQNLYKPEVTQNLRVLYPFQETKDTLRRYYAEKMSTVLLVLFAGVHMIAIISYVNRQEAILQEGNLLVRGDYAQASSPISLQVEEEEAKKSYEIPYEIRSRVYSEAELSQMVEQFEQELPDLIRGENQSVEEVTKALLLTQSYEGYPMEMEWESEDYTLVDSDGTVYNEELTQKLPVKLTVSISYMEYQYEYSFSVQVCPKIYTQEEQMELAIWEELQKADELTRAEETVVLPELIDGKKVTYSLAPDYEKWAHLMCLAALVFVLFYAKDQDLGKETERRKNEMTLEYPEFVSKFVLLLGAGMTVRNIFVKMSQDQQQSKYLKQELVILVRDFNNGVLEGEALDRFGRRSGNPLYIKFCALIIQNIKKGTKDLKPQLSQESKEAFQLRKNNARRLGEEAGTKLLVPMVLMLGIVMVLIMVPAFLSFQL